MPEKRPIPLTGEDTIEDHPQLGKYIDNFPSRRLRALLMGWSFLIGLGLLVNLAFWNSDAAWVGPVVIIGIAIIALVVGWWIMHQWNREVIVYERGFTYREGSEDVPFVFAEVQTLRLRAERLTYLGGLFRRTVYHVTISTVGGDRIVLDNTYNSIDRLTDRLTEAVNTALRPRIRYSLQQGHSVAFGEAITLTADGIRVEGVPTDAAPDGTVLPWHDFSGYRVEKGQLLLLTGGELVWFAQPLAEIDNLTLLVEWLQTHQTSAQEASA
jgi:hypothetical protein